MTSTILSDLREMFAEQVEYRELLYQMTLRDLLRYKQTVMGFGWAVFMPLVNTRVFSVIFTRVAPLETPACRIRCSPTAACSSGTSSPRRCASSVISLTGNTNLVTKVYFPARDLPVLGDPRVRSWTSRSAASCWSR